MSDYDTINDILCVFALRAKNQSEWNDANAAMEALNRMHGAILESEREYQNLESEAPISDDCGECTTKHLPHIRTCAHHLRKAVLGDCHD